MKIFLFVSLYESIFFRKFAQQTNRVGPESVPDFTLFCLIRLVFFVLALPPKGSKGVKCLGWLCRQTQAGCYFLNFTSSHIAKCGYFFFINARVIKIFLYANIFLNDLLTFYCIDKKRLKFYQFFCHFLPCVSLKRG